VTTIRKWTGREVHALRKAMRVSQRTFGEKLGVSGRAVGKWEVGQAVPNPDSQAILDTELRMVSDEVRARFELILAGKAAEIAEAASARPSNSRPADDASDDATGEIRDLVSTQVYQKEARELDFIPSGMAVNAPHPGRPDLSVTGKSPDGPIMSGREFSEGTEDVIDVLGRIQKLHRATVHPEVIRRLQDNITHTVARYDSLDHSSLVPSLLKQRGWVESLLDECGNPAQRRELLEIAGVTSGILGYVAAGRGEFPLARAYCLEAFQLGDYADNANVKAWARALQSFCEYYAGRHDKALTLARDGITYMRPGAQSAGFAVNDMALTARSFLASAYRAAGDLSTAAPLHQQNLADCERVLGADHPETLVSRANLAYLYALQDQPARALELHQRNLADCQRFHGPDHPHTLNARANLASCYRALGDLARAIELHRQSVTDYARVFGPDHSETITARSNLAYAYQLANDYGQAIPLYRQVLTDRERLYGPGHLYTEQARQLLTRAEQPV
jgi:tetratricopeptide (TPR) repeat protein/transcriptional regulator with XRE-family HTH domain